MSNEIVRVVIDRDTVKYFFIRKFENDPKWDVGTVVDVPKSLVDEARRVQIEFTRLQDKLLQLYNQSGS